MSGMFATVTDLNRELDNENSDKEELHQKLLNVLQKLRELLPGKLQPLLVLMVVVVVWWWWCGGGGGGGAAAAAAAAAVACAS